MKTLLPHQIDAINAAFESCEASIHQIANEHGIGKDWAGRLFIEWLDKKRASKTKEMKPVNLSGDLLYSVEDLDGEELEILKRLEK
jgi:hypothetical protein